MLNNLKRVKRWSAVIIGCLLVAVVHAQDNSTLQSFTITGTVADAYRHDTLMLQYLADGRKHKDTILLSKGNFRVKGKVSKLEVAYLALYRKNKGDEFFNVRKLYIEPGGEIRITGAATWSDFTIDGGPIQKDWAIFEKLHYEVRSRYSDALRMDKEVKDRDKQLEQMKQDFIRTQNAFIVAHPSSYISWDILQNRGILIDENPYLLEALMEIIDPKYKETSAYKQMWQRIQAVKNMVIGKPVPDFSCVDTSGKAYKLSDFRGKYVLVDFWASWCGFCRAQTPTLKKVYEKYKDKNFTIVALSYDENKERWMKAIHEDSPPWIQLSELKGIPEAPSSQLYGIRAIPQNVLLDPEGNLVARNIQVTEFDKKIGEVLGQ